jgi:FlaA1/EpsC-like NDP-sugar epimerase
MKKYSRRIKQLLNKGKRVVIWGAGARGVTFLNILKDPRIEYAVDINPRKQGMYVPGTGQKIVKPRFLSDYQPDYVILANPAYENEIRQIIINLKIETEIIRV